MRALLTNTKPTTGYSVGPGQEMDVTVQLRRYIAPSTSHEGTSQLRRYIEQLEAQGGNRKFLFPSFKADLQAKKVVRLWKLNEAISYNNARKALLSAVKAAKRKIKVQNGVFGLHSFRVGALTAAANTGQFSNMQLQNMGRWAQLDSAARYFLPREEEKLKVGREIGTQLKQAMEDEVLEGRKGLEGVEARCLGPSSGVKAAAAAAAAAAGAAVAVVAVVAARQQRSSWWLARRCLWCDLY